MDSYGYVETRGLVTAIEAADAALKAANVTLTNYYYVKGGIVTIEVMGDVAAVNAAVDAAVERCGAVAAVGYLIFWGLRTCIHYFHRQIL